MSLFVRQFLLDNDFQVARPSGPSDLLWSLDFDFASVHSLARLLSALRLIATPYYLLLRTKPWTSGPPDPLVAMYRRRVPLSKR